MCGRVSYFKLCLEAFVFTFLLGACIVPYSLRLLLVDRSTLANVQHSIFPLLPLKVYYEWIKNVFSFLSLIEKQLSSLFLRRILVLKEPNLHSIF